MYPINNKIKNINIFKKPQKTKTLITYSFLFVSLISPYVISNIKNFFNQPLNKNKLLLKQSYMILTWFYYLSFINFINKQDKTFSFFVSPLKRQVFTLNKAPMAHKNWSKEQYKFQFYLIRVSFRKKTLLTTPIKDINFSLLFILLSKQNFPFFESNLLLLKNYWFFFFFSDKKYFNYYNYHI